MRIAFLVILTTLFGCGDTIMSNETFFRNPDGTPRFKATELGNTQLVVGNTEVGLRGGPVKFINLQAPDSVAQPVTITFRAEYFTIQNLPGGGALPPLFPPVGTPVFGSPLVALVKWGTGGAYQQIEFDIPGPKTQPGQFSLPPVGFPGQAPVADVGAGTSITLAGSAFEIQVRNDGNLAPLVAPAGGDHIGEPFPAKVMVQVGPAVGSESLASRRVIWVCAGKVGPNPLAPAANVSIPIPPMAKRVWVMRQPIDTTPVDLAFRDTINGNNRFRPVPVNSEGPVEIHPGDASLGLFNRGAVNIDFLQMVFDVTPN
jgi:hypothetical protein